MLFLLLRKFRSDQLRDDVPVRENAVIGGNPEELVTGVVRNVDLASRAGIASMCDLNDRRVQTNTDLVIGEVELGVIARGENDIFHRRSWNRSGNQRANEHARDRRVAVRKMEDVRFG